MFHLIAAALSGAALTAAVYQFLWKRRMRQTAAEPTAPPLTNLTEWDLITMAYHEAGHAVCSYYLPEREPLLKITISPSDEAFGMIRTAVSPHHNETRVSFASTLAVLLAGRTAEELFLHEVTTGCVHDLTAARQLAAALVLNWGMGSRIGLTLPPPELNCGENLRNQCDADIQELLADAARSARVTLTEHAEEVEELVDILLAQDTIEQPEIDAFFEKRRAKKLTSRAKPSGTTKKARRGRTAKRAPRGGMTPDRTAAPAP